MPLWDQHLPHGVLYHQTDDDDDDDDDSREEIINPFNVQVGRILGQLLMWPYYFQDPNVLYERDYDPGAGERYEDKLQESWVEADSRWWEGRVQCPPRLLRSKESLWTLSE